MLTDSLLGKEIAVDLNKQFGTVHFSPWDTPMIHLDTSLSFSWSLFGHHGKKKKKKYKKKKKKAYAAIFYRENIRLLSELLFIELTAYIYNHINKNINHPEMCKGLSSRFPTHL